MLSWGVINVKPLKIWILENLLEENPTPQHGCVRVGLLCWLGPRPGHAVCSSIRGRVVFCWAWLLRSTCSRHWLCTIQIKKRDYPCWIISFGPEKWTGEHILANVLLLKLCGCCCCCCLQNKFLAVKKTTYISHFIGTQQWMLRDFIIFLRDLKPEFG